MTNSIYFIYLQALDSYLALELCQLASKRTSLRDCVSHVNVNRVSD
jgi:hypothetical protein